MTIKRRKIEFNCELYIIALTIWKEEFRGLSHINLKTIFAS